MKNDTSFIQGDHNDNLIFTNGYDIFAALGSIYIQTEQNILRIEGNTFEPALDWPQDGTRLYPIWFKNMNEIFVSKSNPTGIATYGPDKKWRHDTRFEVNWLLRNIQGNDINDIWVTGEHHYIAHSNGILWKNFPEIERFGPLYGMDVKDDVMVARGRGNSATVIMVKPT